jgi:nucleotide-binding universal stress UspA family protein
VAPHVSNAASLVRDDRAPVTIVVGLDDTDAALHALDYAIGAARRSNGRVIAAHAQQLITPVASISLLTPAAGATSEAAVRSAESAVNALAALSDAARRESGVDIQFRVLHGDPATALAELATEVCADLVIVGASRHPGSHLFSSVSRRLNRKARWPLAIVP